MVFKKLSHGLSHTIDKAALRLMIAGAQKKWLKHSEYPTPEKIQELERHYLGQELNKVFSPPEKCHPRQLDKETYSFESHFSPSLKPLVVPYSSYKENYEARFKWIKPSGTPRATMYCIHGWQGGHFGLDVKCFRGSKFLEQGFSLCFIELPFHGQRESRTKTSPFPSTNIDWTLEAIAQSIHDLRIAKRFIEERSKVPSFILGMSLGAYVASLWATLDSFEFIAALCPAVDLAGLIWNHDQTSLLQRKASNHGVTEMDFRKLFSLHSPLARPLKVPRESRQIVVGSSDAITPPNQAQALAAHWECPMTTITGGHVSFVTQSKPWELVLKRALGALS